jgi:hypothetical protein
VPQAGLDTTTRDGPLARLIVDAIVEGADPEAASLYNSRNWCASKYSRSTPN